MNSLRIVDSVWSRIALLIVIFFLSTSWLWFLVYVVRPTTSTESNNLKNFETNSSDYSKSHVNEIDTDKTNPESDHDDGDAITFPTNIKQLKNLAKILSSYYETNRNYVLVLFSCAYLYKQTFAIPGSVFLNLLGGAIFGTSIAFVLCSILTAIGSSFAFGLSHLVGRSIVIKYFPDKIQIFQQTIVEQKQKSKTSLFLTLISLRLFPMTPNWFLNIASPIIGVPIHQFFPSVLIGLMPYNYLTVQTGSILSDLIAVDNIMSIKTAIILVTTSLAFMAPTIKRLISMRT
ncbi:Transmembrane protein 41A [Sarcoptes scabiei]|uniref:Transmembrane protein 41A n=1 Tax=Sarcoptes scabiei TaxID=52283 RepID=A0A834RH47_SARSC|nr:Transmembrane protein 41A [Sarcoptes scabiei]